MPFALWGIFVLVYLAMALGRIPGLAVGRTAAAMLGAIAMLAVGGISLRDAVESIDAGTLLLLFALMIFSAQLRAAGLYDAISRKLAALAEQPRKLLLGVILAAAVVSALLANDIVCLAFTPILCEALLSVRRRPLPYLVALATASNIGSAATIIGNPQNMYIGTVANLAFGRFTLVMLPPVILGLILCWLIVVLVWRSDFVAGQVESDGSWVSSTTPLPREFSLEPRRVVFVLMILAAVVGVFLFSPAEGRIIAALAGAGIVLVSRRRDRATLYQRVDWELLLLFIGLFVVNGTMKDRGLTAKMIDGIGLLHVRLDRPVPLSAAATVMSNIVSNVPAVLLLKPAIPLERRDLWYVLAYASTVAGNLTLVGSIANLIVAEQAARLGVTMDLKNYCKVGVPLTVMTVVMGTMWIVVVG